MGIMPEGLKGLFRKSNASSLDEANWEAEGGLRDQFKSADFDEDSINKIKEACLGLKLNEITAGELAGAGSLKDSSQLYQAIKIIRPHSPETRNFFAQAFLQPMLSKLKIDDKEQKSIIDFYTHGNLDQRIAELELPEGAEAQIKKFIQSHE